MPHHKLNELVTRLADGRMLFRETFEGSLIEGTGAGNGAVRFVEADNSDEKILGTVTGVAAKADIINKNKRLYSKKVYELAVGRAQSLLGQNIFLGEVDHPWYGSLQGAAARFTKVWMDGDLMKFEAVVLKTEAGIGLRALLDGGVGAQVSTRGYASATTEKRDFNGVEVDIAIIGEDYTMEGIDFVLFASNPFGRVNQESTTTEVTTMLTLEKLKAENPDLVAQIEASARVGFVAQAEVESQVTAATAAARTEGIEAGKAEALDSAEVKGRAAVIATIAEAVKAYLPVVESAKAETEMTEAEKTIKELKDEVTKLTGTVSTLTESSRTATEAAAKAETSKAIADKVKSVLEGFKHAELLETDLLACESVDAVQTMFDARKTLIEQTLARAGVIEAKGKGEADVTGVETTETLTEAEQKQLKEVNFTRAVSGLAPLTTLAKK